MDRSTRVACQTIKAFWCASGYLRFLKPPSIARGADPLFALRDSRPSIEARPRPLALRHRPSSFPTLPNTLRQRLPDLAWPSTARHLQVLGRRPNLSDLRFRAWSVHPAQILFMLPLSCRPPPPTLGSRLCQAVGPRVAVATGRSVLTSEDLYPIAQIFDPPRWPPSGYRPPHLRRCRTPRRPDWTIAFPLLGRPLRLPAG